MHSNEIRVFDSATTQSTVATIYFAQNLTKLLITGPRQDLLTFKSCCDLLGETEPLGTRPRAQIPQRAEDLLTRATRRANRFDKKIVVVLISLVPARLLSDKHKALRITFG